MSINYHRLKTILSSLVFGLVLTGLPLVSNLVPTAHADGETYTWSDRQTIRVTGGMTRGDIPPLTNPPNVLNVQTSPTPGQPIRVAGQFYVTGTPADNAGAGSLKDKGTCLLNVNGTLTSDTSATVTGSPPAPGGISSSQGCRVEVYNNFHGSTVTIQGTRPGAGTETAAQKLVDVTFFSPTPFGQAPDGVSVTIKDSAGTVVDGPRTLPKEDPHPGDNRPKAQHDADYNFRYTLNPGTYSICADYVITCETFEKKQGEPLTGPKTLVYGQSQDGGRITAIVQVSFFINGTDPTKNVGPFDISVTEPDGTVRTFQTESKSFPAPAGSAGTTQSRTEEVWAPMSPFAQTGNHKVCVVLLNVCKDVDKQQNTGAEVRFSFGANDSDKLIAASTGGANAQKPTCESSGDAASYFLCPIFNGLSGLASWLFESVLQPFLTTPPISTDPNDPSFKIWATVRVYGDIFLVFALLVVVFGEALGADLLDVAAKKSLPRILVAAIFINLSVYIMALLVDLTNIIAATIGHVLTAPIDMKWKPDSGTAGGVFTIGLAGLLLGSGALITTLVGVFTLKAAFIKSALWVVFFMLLPIVFSVIAIFVTLVIRKGLLLFLVLVSPVAFALYCLPNTEKYFFSFVKLTFRTLAVSIVIMVIYSVGQILSITTLEANQVGPDLIKNANWGSVELSKTLAFLVSIIILYVVLAASAWAFKWAGGLVGVIDDGLSKGRARAQEGLKGRRELARQKFQGLQTQNRERAFRALGDWGADKGRLGRGIASMGQGRLSAGGLRNVLGESAMYRKQQMEIAEAINATGDDSHLRASTINKEWALANDRTGGKHWRWKDGKVGGSRQFRSMGGAWFSENDVDQAKKSYGNNQAILQWAVGHEMDKAATQEEQDYLKTNFTAERINYGPNGMKMSNGELQGMWKGAAFQKQNVNRAWKHFSVDDNGELKFDRMSAVREMDEKKGAYELGQTNADYWTSMSQGVLDARQRHDQLTAASQTRQLNAQEQTQLQDDKEYLGRASRIAGRLQATGALYGAGGGEGGPPPQMLPGPVVGGEGAELSPQRARDMTPEELASYRAQQAAVAQERKEAGIGAGAISRTGEEMVRFARVVGTHATEYTGPAMAEGPQGSAPGVPAEEIEPYGKLPGTEDSIQNRAPGFPTTPPGTSGVNTGGNPDINRRTPVH